MPLYSSLLTEGDSIFKKKKKKRRNKKKEHISYNGAVIHMPENFLVEPLQARREWHAIFKVLKEENFYPRTIYLVEYFLNMKEKYILPQTNELERCCIRKVKGSYLI